MSTGLSQELEDGLDFGDDEGEELTIEEAEEGARAFDAAQVDVEAEWALFNRRLEEIHRRAAEQAKAQIEGELEEDREQDEDQRVMARHSVQLLDRSLKHKGTKGGRGEHVWVPLQARGG